MTHISHTIKILLPGKGDLPDRIQCTRRDVAGKTYTWSAKDGMYLADDGGPGFMTWYVARGFGVIFRELKSPIHHLVQRFLAGL